MIIRIERDESAGAGWNAYKGNDEEWIAHGATREKAIIASRQKEREAMERLPLLPEEIPGELRELAKRMRALSEPLIYFGGFGARGDLGRALEAQAPIMSAWADLIEDLKP